MRLDNTAFDTRAYGGGLDPIANYTSDNATQTALDAWNAALARAGSGQITNPGGGEVASAGHTTVEERFNEIGSIGPIHYYHAYIVVTDPSGHETYFRGGPTDEGPSGSSSQSSSGSGGSSSQGTRSSSGGSGSSSPSSNSSNSTSPGSGPGGNDASNGPWGSLTTMHGDYVPGTIDYNPNATRVVVAVQDGDQSKADIAKLEHAADSINDKHLPYNPFTTNSNAAARTMLEDSGFTPANPPVTAPGWDWTL